MKEHQKSMSETVWDHVSGQQFDGDVALATAFLRTALVDMNATEVKKSV